MGRGLLRTTVVVYVLGVTTPVCAQSARAIRPSCQKAFGADLCVGGKMSGGMVVEVDALIPMSAITSAPKKMDMKWPPSEAAVVSLPPEIRSATGIQTLTFYWEAMGHPPQPFMTPHFDFHFTTISETERKALDCSDHAKPQKLPSGYVLTDDTIPDIGVLVGTCVPLMGMHALAMAGQPAPFSATMVLGYYHGRPIFFEPMISQATLLSKKSLSLPISAPAGSSHFPTMFKASYDAKAKAYRFAFTGFKTTKENAQ